MYTSFEDFGKIRFLKKITRPIVRGTKKVVKSAGAVVSQKPKVETVEEIVERPKTLQYIVVGLVGMLALASGYYFFVYKKE